TSEGGITRWPARLLVSPDSSWTPGHEMPAGGTLDLGVVKVGSRLTRTIVLSNYRSGSETMTIGPITLTGQDAAEFSIASPPALNAVAESSFTTFDLEYAPVTPGIKHAALRIVTSA